MHVISLVNACTLDKVTARLYRDLNTLNFISLSWLQCENLLNIKLSLLRVNALPAIDYSIVALYFLPLIQYCNFWSHELVFPEGDDSSSNHINLKRSNYSGVLLYLEHGRSRTGGRYYSSLR